MSNTEQPYYLGERKMGIMIGRSKEFLKKCRFEGRLNEGIHWVKLNSRVLYNVQLVLDWIQNQGDPTAHQKAIEFYFSKLPCNNTKTRKNLSSKEK